jgi:hypothetical protein
MPTYMRNVVVSTTQSSMTIVIAFVETSSLIAHGFVGPKSSVVCIIRNNLENDLLPEMKQSVEQLKQLRDSQLLTEQSPSTARLTVRLTIYYFHSVAFFRCAHETHSL